MKTLGKAMKICHAEGNNKAQALRQLLASYRCTPHRSTGQSPGNLMFHGGYKQDFPKKVLAKEDIAKARESDMQGKIARQTYVNSSCRRKQSIVKEGDLVLVRNEKKKKFDPIFGPEKYQVITLFEDGAKIKRLSDGKHFVRHLNDVKLMTCDWDTITHQHRRHTGHGWIWHSSEEHGNTEQNIAQRQEDQPQIAHRQPQSDQEEEVAHDDPIIESDNAEAPERPTLAHVPRALSRLADYNTPGYSELDL